MPKIALLNASVSTRAGLNLLKCKKIEIKKKKDFKVLKAFLLSFSIFIPILSSLL